MNLNIFFESFYGSSKIFEIKYFLLVSANNGMIYRGRVQ